MNEAARADNTAEAANAAQAANATSAAEMDALLQEVLKAQLALNESVAATSQFLRFTLSLAGENLNGIRSQLERIRDLAATIEGYTAY